MELLTVEQVVERYGFDKTSVYRRLHTEAWAPFVTKLGTYRVIREGLEDWIARGGDLCRTTLDATKTRSTGTHESRSRAANAATGRAHARPGRATPDSSQNTGTPLRLRIIESSRPSKRFSS
jgi:hypothetical protein